MPHLASAAVALVAAVVYAAAAFFMTAADFDPSPLSSNIMAASSSLPLVKVGGGGWGRASSAIARAAMYSVDVSAEAGPCVLA
jgi:hypothetical protein